MSSRGEPQSVAPIGLDSAGGLTLTVGLVWTIADWSRHRRSKRTPLRVPGHRPQSARISPVSRQGEPNLSRRVIRLSGESLRRMMPRMSRFPVRVVCHANLRIDLVPARVRELEATIRRRCQESDAQLVDFCVDLGKPKRRPEDYPALNDFRAGKADALLIVCMPSDDPLPRGDLLTSRALSGFPAGWLAVPKLREVGLLPQAIG